MAAFTYVSQILDGEERVIRVPESSLSTWLPRGWALCDPPERRRAAVAQPAEIPAAAPAPAKPAPTKKVERSTSDRELKSEDNI